MKLFLQAAIVVALIAGWRLWQDGGGARRLSEARPAAWGAPESEAEARLLARVEEPGGRQRLARQYLSEGRPFAAVWQLLEADAKDSGGPERTLLVATALARGRWYDAATRRLKPLVSGHAGARVQLAEIYLSTGHPERAAALWLASGPTPEARSVEEWVAFGRACQAEGRDERAQQVFERAARAFPSAAEPCYRLGRLLLASGKEERAASWLRQAMRRDTEDPRFPVALAQALLGSAVLARRQEAGRQLAAVVERWPEFAPARLQLGIFHQSEGRWREAGREFLATLRYDPQNAEAHRRLAELMALLGEPARAEYHRGWAFVFDDQPQHAVAAFQAMAAADPTNVEAWLLISQGYTEMVQNVRGAEEVEKALARHPDNPQLVGRLAGLYFITHNRRAAGELCAAWRRRDPKAVEPIWMEGKLAIASHRLDEGIRLLSEAVARDPANPEYAFDLGEALARRPSPENLRAALAVLSRAVQVAPTRARYRYQLAVVLQRLGEWEAARRQLLRVLDQDPQHPQAANGLVAVAQALKRPEIAAFWAEAVPGVQEAVQAETDLRRKVGQHPEDGVARLRLAERLVRRGALAKARAHLRECLRLRPGWDAVAQKLAVVEGCLAVEAEGSP